MTWIKTVGKDKETSLLDSRSLDQIIIDDEQLMIIGIIHDVSDKKGGHLVFPLYHCPADLPKEKRAADLQEKLDALEIELAITESVFDFLSAADEEIEE
jgi:hypothetical protein